MEKPEDPQSNLVMTGFYTFSPVIFHACQLVQPSNRGEYEISEAIDLLIRSGQTIDAIALNGWRVDVGYPEDREKAEELLADVSVAGTGGSAGPNRVRTGFYHGRHTELAMMLTTGSTGFIGAGFAGWNHRDGRIYCVPHKFPFFDRLLM